MEQIIEMELDGDTKEKFAVSVKSIQEGIQVLKDNKFFE
jgi:malate dehydrogenase